MSANPRFDAPLIRRYDRPGPRYTSYPTAVDFHTGFGEADYRVAAGTSNTLQSRRPLSLYVHVPFCRSPCFYCGCNKVITRDTQKAAAYMVRLCREIELAGALFDRARPVQQLHFGGGTPTYLDDPQLKELIGALGRSFSLSDDPAREYSIELDPRTVDAQRLAHLVALGFNRFSLGIQDFDTEVQRAVNREQSAEETLALMQAARDLGVKSLSVDLIYGLPKQTPQSFARTLERVAQARPERVAVYSYAHMPHLFKPQRQIRDAELPAPETKLALLGLAIETLTQAGYVYVGLDHFALADNELIEAQSNGTLQRNFQGYSTHAETDLVALGVSAISRVGDTYSQNVKTLGEYYQRLDAGELPVERGLCLTAEDVLRRDVIQTLMCATRLDFAAIERVHDIQFETHFAAELEELQPLVDDGLVVREPRALAITPTGRLLLRNVAMVFDARLRVARAPGATPRFSRVV